MRHNQPLQAGPTVMVTLRWSGGGVPAPWHSWNARQRFVPDRADRRAAAGLSLQQRGFELSQPILRRWALACRWGMAGMGHWMLQDYPRQTRLVLEPFEDQGMVTPVGMLLPRWEMICDMHNSGPLRAPLDAIVTGAEVTAMHLQTLQQGGWITLDGIHFPGELLQRLGLSQKAQFRRGSGRLASGRQVNHVLAASLRPDPSSNMQDEPGTPAERVQWACLWAGEAQRRWHPKVLQRQAEARQEAAVVRLRRR